MPRSNPEWIGATPDSAIPPRVRLRLADHDKWKCRKCARPLALGKTLNTDHVIALVNGGENRERNLQSLCDWCHKHKTRADVALKSATYKTRKRHYGVRRAKQPIQGWRRFDGTPVRNPKLRRAR
jgi:hypothetical protein